MRGRCLSLASCRNLFGHWTFGFRLRRREAVDPKAAAGDDRSVLQAAVDRHHRVAAHCQGRCWLRSQLQWPGREHWHVVRPPDLYSNDGGGVASWRDLLLLGKCCIPRIAMRIDLINSSGIDLLRHAPRQAWCFYSWSLSQVSLSMLSARHCYLLERGIICSNTCIHSPAHHLICLAAVYLIMPDSLKCRHVL
jgi:hypothetical protein